MAISFQNFCDICKELPAILEEGRKRKPKAKGQRRSRGWLRPKVRPLLTLAPSTPRQPKPVVKYPQRILANSPTAKIIARFIPIASPKLIGKRGKTLSDIEPDGSNTYGSDVQ